MAGAVLVTGASSGIGRATALRLDRSGFDVFAAVRREDDGRSLAAEASDRLRTPILDVTDAEAIAAVAAELADATGDRGLAGLVNNAGIVVSGPLEFLALEELRQQLEVNVVGQVAVTQAVLPLIRTARGRIVNVGSVGGRVAKPVVGAYGASKHALEALTDALRMELRPWGIHVAIVEPSSIATPIWRKGADVGDERLAAFPERARELYGDQIEGLRRAADRQSRRAADPEIVAKAVEHALTADRPRTRYLVGPQARAQVVLKALLPARRFDALLARIMR